MFKDIKIPANRYLVFDFIAAAYVGSISGGGTAVVLGNYSIDPAVGVFGKALGYSGIGSNNGFAGGWLGIGLDTFGNFSNLGLPGDASQEVQNVVLRGLRTS